jgi:hypothetical protein
MVAMRTLSQFSLLVSQQNHSDLSLEVLDDAHKRIYPKKGIFREQKMSNSAKAKLGDLVAKEPYHLQEQKILKICAAIEALVYGAEKFSPTKRRQLQVHLK